MTKTKVSWLPWTEESFRKAKELDRPILLDISAVWCHWCHIMDQTSYSDNEVTKLIEDSFVPIRVDRDQRPDIDKRYNMGGWPSTAFLTPNGEILIGGTYIPLQQMATLLKSVSELYHKKKDIIKSRIKELEKETQKSSIIYNLGSKDFLSVIDSLTLRITSQFDSVYGGFSYAPKFPHSEALRFSLLQYHLQGYNSALNIVEKTLAAMGDGGIYDKEEGGFFRYSTTRDWSIPHYEKMCEDNAKLLSNYLETYQVTGKKKFRDIAKGILAYINAKLSDHENGGFYGSQDADDVYYKLSLSERQNRIPPTIDRTLFVNWNSMMVSSYLLASIVLEDKNNEDFALQTIDLLLEAAFSSKNGMSHYIIEGKSHLSGLLTDQVYMVKCLIDAYQVTSDRKYLDNAELLADFMLDKLWDNDGGFYDKPKNVKALGALRLLDKPLNENSVAAEVFLRLYHLIGKQKYLAIAEKTLEHFASTYQRYGIMASVYGVSVELFLHPMRVHIVGSIKDSSTRKLRVESLKIYNPLKVVETLDPILDIDRLKILHYPVVDIPTAFVCFKGKCTSVENPDDLEKKIRG
jgi:uncharacterized protein YyaL (SSP411 family)